MLTLDTSIRFIKGIGEARYNSFAGMGITTAGELLAFLPRAYEDRGNVVPIASTYHGQLCSVEVTVCETAPVKKVRQGMTVLRCVVRDDSASMELVFFNSPFLAKTLVKGKKFRAYGRIRYSYYGREMSAPKLEPIYSGKILKGLVPVYRLTPPLTQKIISDAVSAVISLCDSIPSVLPQSVIEAQGLMTRGEAIKELHIPTSADRLAAARRTLAFEELTVFQIALSGLRRVSRTGVSEMLSLAGCGIAKFFEALPYELTGAQKRVIKEIVADMAKPVPMARLVQGDVGSGKTVVAASAIYLCVKNGFQACMMAPTEILARQHKKTLEGFLAPFGIRVELLVSALPASEKRRIRAELKNGDIDVIVGTHALITDDTEFRCLALAVTDEQHRFGVAQRARILEKSERNNIRAHMLVMSATPIPRSLSLIIYGDLDVSLLDELPKGRKPVETRCIRESDLEKVYDLIKKEVASGGRAYIVCALIEESEDSDRKAAETHYKALSENVFAGIPMGLIHGKMKPAEKEKAMAHFASGETQILVSTTVIEVGVDVPEATVMVIENAECFGLSQLHQLRGRIGRGSRKSVCILVNGSDSESAASRLDTMCKISDGFGIADADLALRGPGDFFGERQSGESGFSCASVSDMPLVEKTRQLARAVESDSDNPEYKLLLDSARKYIERTGHGKTVN